MDYKKLNDYELVYQVKENDEVAYEVLIKKYSTLVSMLAREYYQKNKNIGLEFDDFYQEGMVGLMRALDDYDSSNSLFYTYAYLCTKRQIETCVRMNQRKKHLYLNTAVSLSDVVKNDTDLLLEDIISSPVSIERDYMFNDLYNRILEFKYDLSMEEAMILELRMNSFTIGEISTLLSLTRKNVDYRLHKISKKISNFINV